MASLGLGQARPQPRQHQATCGLGVLIDSSGMLVYSEQVQGRNTAGLRSRAPLGPSAPSNKARKHKGVQPRVCCHRDAEEWHHLLTSSLLSGSRGARVLLRWHAVGWLGSVGHRRRGPPSSSSPSILLRQAGVRLSNADGRSPSGGPDTDAHLLCRAEQAHACATCPARAAVHSRLSATPAQLLRTCHALYYPSDSSAVLT